MSDNQTNKNAEVLSQDFTPQQELDQLFEGYTFRRREGDLFIFGNQLHELEFTFSTVKDSLIQKRQEVKTKVLTTALESVGVFKLKFYLPQLNFSLDRNRKDHRLDDEYRIVNLEDNHDYVSLISRLGEKKRVHISLILKQQANEWINELKEIEKGFDALSLKFIVQRISTLKDYLNHESSQTTWQDEASLTQARICVLIIERLEHNEQELLSLFTEELQLLQQLLLKEIDLLQGRDIREIQKFQQQAKRVTNYLMLLKESVCYSLLNEKELLDLFRPIQLRDNILRAIIDQIDLKGFIKEQVTTCYQYLTDMTGLSLQQLTPDLSDIDSFISFIFDVQDLYINSQLRVGKNDFSLIKRFRITATKHKVSYPLLKSHQELTRHERLKLHQELIDYRLNLIFDKQLNEETLKYLAKYNVNDFYDLFYKISTKH